MPKGVYKLPNANNEPIKSYAPGSPERQALKLKLAELQKGGLDLPMIIDGKEVRTDNLKDIRPPHNHQRSWHEKYVDAGDGHCERHAGFLL